MNDEIKIITSDWLCVSIRDTGGVGDLQSPSDSAHFTRPHPSDPGGSDRYDTTISPPCLISLHRKCLLCCCRRH